MTTRSKDTTGRPKRHWTPRDGDRAHWKPQGKHGCYNVTVLAQKAGLARVRGSDPANPMAYWIHLRDLYTGWVGPRQGGQFHVGDRVRLLYIPTGEWMTLIVLEVDGDNVEVINSLDREPHYPFRVKAKRLKLGWEV